MRKKIIVILTVLALLFAMQLSGNAQAKVGTSNINIRNHTGGKVTLVLKSADGNTTLTLPDGVYNLSFPSVVYNYYAVTPCGNQGGVFNLTSSKQMYFFCGNGPDIFLQNAPKSTPVTVDPCAPILSGYSPSSQGHALRKNVEGTAIPTTCSK